METSYQLSEQAVMCLMIALQKALIEEIDITDLLREMQFTGSHEGLIVLNPPEPVTPERLQELVDAIPVEMETV